MHAGRVIDSTRAADGTTPTAAPGQETATAPGGETFDLRARESQGWIWGDDTAGPPLDSPLPALVSVTAGVVEPRYPSFKGIMAAKSKPVEELDLAGLGIDASSVGTAGAGQEIVAVEDAPAREAGEIIEDDGEAFGKIVTFLDGLKVI